MNYKSGKGVIQRGVIQRDVIQRGGHSDETQGIFLEHTGKGTYLVIRSKIEDNRICTNGDLTPHLKALFKALSKHWSKESEDEHD